MRAGICLVIALLPTGSWAADPSVELTAQRLVLNTGDRRYTVDDQARIQPLDLTIHVVGRNQAGKPLWLEQKTFAGFKLLRDEPAVKVVSGTWALTEGLPRYRVELEFEVRAGLPCLIVRSVVRQTSEALEGCYYYWGLGAPVTHYTSSGAPAREFSRSEWDLRGRTRWMYLSHQPTGRGLGVMTDGRVGRAPASGEGQAAGEAGAAPYLICTPRSATLRAGGTLEVTFAAMAAASAAEVAAAYSRWAGTSGDRVFFDARSWPRAAVSEPRRPPASQRLQTGDGLTLALSDDGRVADLRVGEASLPPAGSTPKSGLLLRDCRGAGDLLPVGGRVMADGDRLTQRGTAADVAVTATYRAWPGRLEVAGELLDQTGADRAISLYFALPVDRSRGWHWGDNLELSRAVAPEEEYLTAAADQPLAAGANGLSSLYPLATLSGPVGLALSVPMDQPRLCRLAYNADTEQFYVVFDLALTPATKRFPSRAGFSLSIYRFDPAWGFRAGLQRYYDLFAAFFAKRIQRDGGWVCWGNCADVPNLAELGFAYHWGLSGPQAVRFANQHQLYAFPYIEATNLHQTMEEFASATSDDVVKRLRWMADPNRREPLPRWKYDHPYQACLGDREAALRRSAAAYLTSLLFDRQGLMYGSASKTEFDLLIAKYVPCNANPELPGGIGQYFLDFWLPKVTAHMESQGGRIDGIAMDNFHVGGTALGYRREQFAYEGVPLTFETRTGEPVLLKEFTTYEFTAEAARRLRAEGRYLIANACGPVFPFTWHLLDVPGVEWGIESVAPWARAMTYHKPVVSLPVQPPHKAESWIKWHLRYGFMPGGYANSTDFLNRPAMARYAPIARALQAAGWEPITAARSDREEVSLERFGGRDGPLYFTVYNRSQSESAATVTIAGQLAKEAAVTTAVDVLTGTRQPLANGCFRTTVAARDVQVWRLER